MTEPTVATPSAQADSTAGKSFSQRLAGVLGSVVYDLEEERISPGDRAALRRGWREPGGPAFWKLAVRHLEPGGMAVADAGAERRWSAVLAGMADMAGLLRSRRRFGRALADGNVSEGRLLRLLRAHDETLIEALRAVVHQLASSGQGFDWFDPARLVLLDGSPRWESEVRRKIAMDFYRAAPTQTSPD